MKAITRISPPHFGQTSGSTSLRVGGRWLRGEGLLGAPLYVRFIRSPSTLNLQPTTFQVLAGFRDVLGDLGDECQRLEDLEVARRHLLSALINSFSFAMMAAWSALSSSV